LRVPIGAVLTLIGNGRPGPEWFFHDFCRRFPPFAVVDELPDFPEVAERVSFRQLADLYVRTFAVQSIAEWWRTEPRQKGKWGAFHEVAWRILEGRWNDMVFFGRPPAQEGIAGLLDAFVKAVPEADREWLAKRLALCLDRIEVKDGDPIRLYPFSRVPAEGCPRIVVIDPRIRFGRPTVADRGVPTDVLFERHQAGESIAELAEDYDAPAAEVEEVIRYEAMPPVLLLPFPGW
jgi:uncharacterized protein (DUF433 family)